MLNPPFNTPSPTRFTPVWNAAWAGNYDQVLQCINEEQGFEQKKKLIKVAMQALGHMLLNAQDKDEDYKALHSNHMLLAGIYTVLPSELRPEGRALADQLLATMQECLEKAIDNNKIEKLKHFLDLPVFKTHINTAHSIAKISFFHQALKLGHLDIAHCLKENGADVNQCLVEDSTLLVEMAKERNLPACQFLIEHCGYNPNEMNVKGMTPLFATMEAISSYNEVPQAVNLIEYLFTKGALPNKLNSKGESLLKRASRMPYCKDLHVLLLSHGAKFTPSELGFAHNRKTLKELSNSIISAAVEDRMLNSSKLTVMHKSPAHATRVAQRPLTLVHFTKAREIGVNLTVLREHCRVPVTFKRKPEQAPAESLRRNAPRKCRKYT